MNRTRQPGPDAAHRVLLWLLVSAAAVLSARSPQWASALTTAAAVHTLADPDRRSRP